MSFNPRAVFLIGPLSDYFSIYLSENKSYLCSLSASQDITSYPFASAYIDCSGQAEWPDTYLGNKKGQGRLYAWGSNNLSGPHMPILAENRIVTSDGLQVWKMDGDIVAGCEPILSTGYTPLYETMWGDYPTSCAKATNDYFFVHDDFYPESHKSYITFYRLLAGAESDRVDAVRSNVFNPIGVPAFRTTFSSQKSSYTFWARSYGDPPLEQSACFIWQYSHDVTFSTGVTTVETWASRITQGYPPVYLWHTASLSGLFDNNTYFRVKRVNKLNGEIVSDSAWTATWVVTASTRFDTGVLDNSPSFEAYYVYRYYHANDSVQAWFVSVIGQQGGADQEPDIVRIQVSPTPEFTEITNETMENVSYDPNGWMNNCNSYLSLTNTDPHYVRCRYETNDARYGPWSNVFIMNGDYPTNYTNWFGYYGYTYIVETHWLGERTTYVIASESVYKDGHVYALLCRTRWVYGTNSVSWDSFYGTLFLADYDGSSVTLSQIGEEVSSWYPDGWPTHYDIVEFNSKLYAGWCDPSDPTTNIYDWCEITNGVVGTIHHVPFPIGATGVNWATMAVIRGDLRVVAGLEYS